MLYTGGEECNKTHQRREKAVDDREGKEEWNETLDKMSGGALRHPDNPWLTEKLETCSCRSKRYFKVAVVPWLSRVWLVTEAVFKRGKRMCTVGVESSPRSYMHT